jgi:hypothetical protein
MPAKLQYAAFPEQPPQLCPELVSFQPVKYPRKNLFVAANPRIHLA